jgi:hypothetical protein
MKYMAALAMVGVANGAEAQSNKQERPIPSSSKENLVAIERAFGYDKPPKLTLFPQIREQMKDAPAFLRDSVVDVNARTYYRDVLTNSTTSSWQEAWAGGGSIAVESGKLFEVFSIGGVVYTSFPLYAPLAHDGTRLLKTGQEGYAVAGQLYGKASMFDQTITVGRYLYDTPYMGPHDNRMSPKTFMGYTLIGKFGDPESGKPAFRYGAGYIAEMKERNEDVFRSIGRSAGANADRGAGVLGGLLQWGPVSFGAIDYYSEDILNIAYVEGKYGASLPYGISAVLGLQFADQRTTGASLTNGGTYYQTNHFGTKLDIDYSTFIVTLAFSAVNPSAAMQTPWSANPIYTDAIIQAFQGAGEQAFMVGASYEFSPVGVKGLAASIYYYRHWSNPTTGSPLVGNEWDFTMDYRPGWEFLSGLWFRARYAFSGVDQNNIRTNIDEVRITVNYALKLY